ncbi:hypothetical protein [Pedobacter nutrimenti]|uniref:Uncharacterized protein n=1 Tax=Pedobacter nutrimenti TaxID=1241337 RepID=A0A318UDT0_9SPHI|nr:hypothetical protein [Pedobacter nutrimenti]PYF72656.1 hypothetical protein B0O44_10521 [Pedobacter nutrimenti]
MILNTSKTENWIGNLFKRDFINEEYCDEEFVDEYLDQRDSDPFDLKWTEANKYLEIYIDQNLSVKEIEEIEKIKEKWRVLFFQKVIKITQHPDLAAYVSEDIDLIIGYMLTGEKNSFIEGMIQSFENGELPG